MNTFVQLAQIFAGIAATIALIYTSLQFKKNSRIAKGQFLLDLREKFSEDRRYEIHLALRNNQPITDWHALEDYLGLFEICEIMIRNNTIELDDFSSLYRYRLQNILIAKSVVLMKFVRGCRSYKNFYSLIRRCFPNKRNEILALQNFSLEATDVNQIDIQNEQFTELWTNLIRNI